MGLGFRIYIAVFVGSVNVGKISSPFPFQRFYGFIFLFLVYDLIFLFYYGFLRVFDDLSSDALSII